MAENAQTSKLLRQHWLFILPILPVLVALLVYSVLTVGEQYLKECEIICRALDKRSVTSSFVLPPFYVPRCGCE